MGSGGIIEGRIMDRILSHDEEQVIRLCHQDFSGLSIEDASAKMGIAVTDVKRILSCAKRKAPQMFPILTTRQRQIVSEWEKGLRTDEIAEVIGVETRTLERDITFLRRHNLMADSPKTVSYMPEMEGHVKEKF